MLHKNLFFRCLENGKLIFCSKKMKTLFGDIVCHCKIHTCAQYETITTNYSLVMVISKLILQKENIVFCFSKIMRKLWRHRSSSNFMLTNMSSSCFGTMRKCHSKIHSYAKYRIYMHGTILNLHHNMKYNYKRGHTMVLIPIRHGSDTNKNITSTKSSLLTIRHMRID